MPAEESDVAPGGTKVGILRVISDRKGVLLCKE